MGVIYLQLQSSRAKTTNRICLHTHIRRYRVYRCLAHATQSVSLLLSFVVVVAVVVFRRFAKQSQKHPPITKSAAPNRLFALSNFAKHWSSSVQFHRNVREFSHIFALTLGKNQLSFSRCFSFLCFVRHFQVSSQTGGYCLLCCVNDIYCEVLFWFLFRFFWLMYLWNTTMFHVCLYSRDILQIHDVLYIPD